MIPVPSGVRVWLATGVTDMRRGMNGLSLQVQEAFGRDPHAGDLYVFRGRRGDLIKVLWHDVAGDRASAQQHTFGCLSSPRRVGSDDPLAEQWRGSLPLLDQDEGSCGANVMLSHPSKGRCGSGSQLGRCVSARRAGHAVLLRLRSALA